MDAAIAQFPMDSMGPIRWELLEWSTFYSQAGDTDKARHFLDRWAAEVDSTELDEDFTGDHDARSELALAEGQYTDAFAELDAAWAEAPDWVRERWQPIDAARFHDQAGNADSALVLYENYVAGVYLGRLFDDDSSLWVALKRLGEMYEARGDGDKAVEYYNRLVELWVDADPELQEVVTDLKGRIARLVGENR